MGKPPIRTQSNGIGWGSQPNISQLNKEDGVSKIKENMNNQHKHEDQTTLRKHPALKLTPKPKKLVNVFNKTTKPSSNDVIQSDLNVKKSTVIETAPSSTKEDSVADIPKVKREPVVKRSPAIRPKKTLVKTKNESQANAKHNTAVSQPSDNSNKGETITREPLLPGFNKSESDDFIKMFEATVPLIEKALISESPKRIGLRRAVTRPGKRPKPTLPALSPEPSKQLSLNNIDSGSHSQSEESDYFDGPTSPLIHMSESAVPCIQKALNQDRGKVATKSKEPQLPKLDSLKPYLPNFDTSPQEESDDDDDLGDYFDHPTSPLIHMSESAVPLIQKTLHPEKTEATILADMVKPVIEVKKEPSVSVIENPVIPPKPILPRRSPKQRPVDASKKKSQLGPTQPVAEAKPNESTKKAEPNDDSAKGKSIPMNLDNVARGVRPLVSGERVVDDSSGKQV